MDATSGIPTLFGPEPLSVWRPAGGLGCLGSCCAVSHRGGMRVRPQWGHGDVLSVEKLPGPWQPVAGLLEAFQAPQLPLLGGGHLFVHLMTADLRPSLPVAPISSGARNQMADPPIPEPWLHRSFQKCARGRGWGGHKL